MSLDRLDGPTRALLALAAAVATGREELVEQRAAECAGSSVPGRWVDEVLLQSTLIVGWPKALAAFAVWRRIGASEAAAFASADEETPEHWRVRGEAVCREVYGKNYAKLRANIRALHPELDAWMLEEGYGRTLGRPGLDLARRELAVAVQMAVQGAGPQLHAHLVGALNAGAAASAVSEMLELVRPVLGTNEAELTMALWERIRR